MTDPAALPDTEPPIQETTLDGAVEAEPITGAVPHGPIVARAGTYYRNARYLMCVGLVVMGAYFLYDGYVGYPKRNAQIDEVNRLYDQARSTNNVEAQAQYGDQMNKLGAKHNDTAIGLQKLLGFALPAAAVGYLIYFLRKSRGQIRLENDVLDVPGHLPVPLTKVTDVDSRLWKKKGIAYLSYDVDGRKGRITLDDFVYQQLPMDAMYDRIVAVRASATPISRESVSG